MPMLLKEQEKTAFEMRCYSVMPLVRLIAATQGAPLPSLSGGFKPLLEAEPQPTRLCHTQTIAKSLI